MKGSAFILDTEWTDRRDPEIIQAAWYEIESLSRPLKIVSAAVVGCKPSKPISFGALSKHHIFADELAGFPPSSELRLPYNTAYLIGHSIDEDWKAYVNTVGNDAASKINPKRICTYAMAPHLWPECDSFSLVAVAYFLEGKSIKSLAQRAHGADSDTDLTLILLNHILKARPEIETFEQLWQFSEQCRIPIFCPFKNREGVRIVDLDDSYLQWMIDQHWLDHYLREAVHRVVRSRQAARGRNVIGDEHDDDYFDDDDMDDEFDDSRVGPEDMEAQ